MNFTVSSKKAGLALNYSNLHTRCKNRHCSNLLSLQCCL